jgi:TIR domain/SIR2-like domain
MHEPSSVPPPLSLFIAYAREDETLVHELKAHLKSLQLEGLISVWHDREIAAGRDWDTDIKEHLESADIILLLVSAAFISSAYCIGVEAARAVARHLTNDARVIPILLRPVEWTKIPVGSGTAVLKLGLLNALPTDGRPVSQWTDADESFLNVTVGLRKVIEEIAEARRARGADVAAPPAASNRTAEPTDEVAPLARSSRRTDVDRALEKLDAFDTITIFVGPRASRGSSVPSLRACDLARNLLGSLKLVDSAWQRLLPSLDTAASYYAMKVGPRMLERQVVEWIDARSGAVPVVHRELARLIRGLGERFSRVHQRDVRPPKRDPQVIVTTNIDLMIERALLAEGVPFTRIVQHQGEPRLDIAQYCGIVRLKNGHIGVPTSRADAERTLGPRVSAADVEPSQVMALQAQLASGTVVVAVDPRDLRSVNAVLADMQGTAVVPDGVSSDRANNQNSLESLSLQELQSPIVYKLRGSQDVAESCALSTEQYLDFLRMADHFVPTQIRTAVAQAPGVFLGFGFLDPDFRLLYYTFQESLVHRRESHPLYAAQVPPGLEPDDNYRCMELEIWEDLKENGPRKARIITLELEDGGEEFIRRLIHRITPQESAA